jgi:glycerol-3-phosphate dehydrogenase
VPLVSLVGGKLTTCRSLAEETATAVLAQFGQIPKVNSRERPLPGAITPYASSKPSALEEISARLLFAAQNGPLDLSRTEILRNLIRSEWVTTLEDLVERRLMLHLRPGLTLSTLEHLAQLLVETGALTPDSAVPAIDACAHRLKTHFGYKF